MDFEECVEDMTQLASSRQTWILHKTGAVYLNLLLRVHRISRAFHDTLDRYSQLHLNLFFHFMYINIYVCLHECILYCQFCFTIHDYTAFVSMVLWTPSVSSCQPVRNKSLPWSKVQTQLGHHYASTSEQFFNEANSCIDMNFSGKRWIGLTTFSVLSLELVDCWKKKLRELGRIWRRWHRWIFCTSKGWRSVQGSGGFQVPRCWFFVKMDMNGPLRTKGSTTSRCWWSQSITLAPNSGMDAADLEGLSFKREFVAAWEVCVQGSVISWQMVFFVLGGVHFLRYNNHHSFIMFHVHYTWDYK